METNVEVYYKKEKDRDRKKDCSCLWIIVAVVAIALAFFVGVLVAALTGIIATLGVGAIITLVIALAVLIYTPFLLVYEKYTFSKSEYFERLIEILRGCLKRQPLFSCLFMKKMVFLLMCFVSVSAFSQIKDGFTKSENGVFYKREFNNEPTVSYML